MTNPIQNNTQSEINDLQALLPLLKEHKARAFEALGVDLTKHNSEDEAVQSLLKHNKPSLSYYRLTTIRLLEQVTALSQVIDETTDNFQEILNKKDFLIDKLLERNEELHAENDLLKQNAQGHHVGVRTSEDDKFIH